MSSQGAALSSKHDIIITLTLYIIKSESIFIKFK